jgi:hypothetical protein
MVESVCRSAALPGARWKGAREGFRLAQVRSEYPRDCKYFLLISAVCLGV